MSDLTLAEVSPPVKDAQSYVEGLATFKVTNVETFQQADEILGAIKVRMDKIHEVFDPICDAAFKAHRQATAKRAEILEPLERLKTQVGRAAATWRQEQERQRLEEERRLREEARKRDEEARIAEAAAAERDHEPELAAAILEEAVTTPAPTVIVPSTTPKLQHASFPEPPYVAVVENRMALVKGVADGRVPLIAVEPNQKYLDQRAFHEKTALNIPGVRAAQKAPGARVR